MNRIAELRQEGQSIWLDYIERGMLQEGELTALVEAGVRGVTSNPSIFQQAIASGSSHAYDDDLHRLVESGHDAKSIFEELAVADIRMAADILRPVYDEAKRSDGFVSIEVAPDLAHDMQATIAEARSLWAAVDRPNVMIKVPATQEGIGAIRQLISEGVNVNVTLIFALDRYSEVMEAYLSGLEDRLAQGRAIDHVASVASFFVSRVDSNVDARLDKLGGEQAAQLKGRVAVANAKLAYHQFQQVFAGPRWHKLQSADAQVQRPLWASTSTKNPAYSDLLYVDTLIGPHTVNTMPPDTLKAFRDHGMVRRTVDQDVGQAEQTLQALKALGISMHEVTDELEAEGVKKFADSYDELLASIEQRRREMEAAR